jgi:hypothetical protein
VLDDSNPAPMYHINSCVAVRRSSRSSNSSFAAISALVGDSGGGSGVDGRDGIGEPLGVLVAEPDDPGGMMSLS